MITVEDSHACPNNWNHSSAESFKWVRNRFGVHCKSFSSLSTLTILWANSAGNISIFFFYFPRKQHFIFQATISTGDNLYEMSTRF